MQVVFVLLYNGEPVSAHPTSQAAVSAEGFFRKYNVNFSRHEDSLDIIEVPFEV